MNSRRTFLGRMMAAVGAIAIPVKGILGMSPPELDQAFTQSFDAKDWAKAFIARVHRNPEIPTDEGCMLGWFANAIMRGFDEANRMREIRDKSEYGYYLEKCSMIPDPVTGITHCTGNGFVVKIPDGAVVKIPDDAVGISYPKPVVSDGVQRIADSLRGESLVTIPRIFPNRHSFAMTYQDIKNMAMGKDPLSYSFETNGDTFSFTGTKKNFA